MATSEEVPKPLFQVTVYDDGSLQIMAKQGQGNTAEDVAATLRVIAESIETGHTTLALYRHDDG